MNSKVVSGLLAVMLIACGGPEDAEELEEPKVCGASTITKAPDSPMASTVIGGEEQLMLIFIVTIPSDGCGDAEFGNLEIKRHGLFPNYAQAISLKVGDEVVAEGTISQFAFNVGVLSFDEGTATSVAVLVDTTGNSSSHTEGVTAFGPVGWKRQVGGDAVRDEIAPIEGALFSYIKGD